MVIAKALHLRTNELGCYLNKDESSTISNSVDSTYFHK